MKRWLKCTAHGADDAAAAAKTVHAVAPDAAAAGARVGTHWRSGARQATSSTKRSEALATLHAVTT
jgi:hypothetical protein